MRNVTDGSMTFAVIGARRLAVIGWCGEAGEEHGFVFRKDLGLAAIENQIFWWTRGQSSADSCGMSSLQTALPILSSVTWTEGPWKEKMIGSAFAPSFSSSLPPGIEREGSCALVLSQFWSHAQHCESGVTPVKSGVQVRSESVPENLQWLKDSAEVTDLDSVYECQLNSDVWS